NGPWLRSAETPRRYGSIEINHIFPRGVTLTNEVFYKGEQFSGDGNTGVHIPSHYVWNFRLGLHILKADLFAQLNNITNRHYSDGFAPPWPTASGGPYPAPQSTRAVAAGVSIRFQN